MSNMKYYDNLKVVPRDALKEISFGKLKGKSDISPQWRYEVMTKEFGVCGIGWKYEIVSTWTQEVKEEVMLFVQINLYVKNGECWSDPIPAIGGDFVLQKDKNGLHGNDEAYKMAITDALGYAMKYLGVAADVYRGLANDSKYGRQPQQQPPQSPPKPQNNQTNTNIPTTQQKHNTPQLMSDIQRKKLFATATEKALSSDDMKKIIAWKYKVDSSTKLTTVQASYLIDNLDKLWSDYVAEQSKKDGN